MIRNDDSLKILRGWIIMGIFKGGIEGFYVELRVSIRAIEIYME
jgi:hypothetical protein